MFPFYLLRLLRDHPATSVCCLVAGMAAMTDHAMAQATAVPRLLKVRTVVAAEADYAPAATLTGDIQPRFLSDLSFRSSGKIASRMVEVGQHVTADDVLARLDPVEQKSTVENARAAVTSAEALLTQAQLTFARQQALLGSGYTTRSAFDNAEQSLRTTQASVDSAKAALGTAQEQLGFTDLKAGVAGVVTARNAEAGQVVQAGETVFTLAQDGPRDAVFNIYEALLAEPPAGKQITVTLQGDPSVTAKGPVREISPTVDAASGTVRVKVELDDPPPRMSLGAIVIGTGRFRPQHGIVLPWSALFRWDDQPAVWLVDPKDNSVMVKPVSVARYADDAIVLSDGVSPGNRVVTAGIQFLRPGQIVAPLEGDHP